MLTDAPAEDAIEVSIFGPGRGESILVHIGQNQWIIVDSCVDQRSGEIPAISYLERIGVDPAVNVRFVVATHMHDDHFAGIARIFERCESATFVCQSALLTPQFMALVRMDKSISAGLRSSAYSEYRRVFELVKERADTQSGVRPLKYLIQERPLVDDGWRKVLALSPSDHAQTRALQALADMISEAETTRKLSPLDPNELAIALWVEVGDKVVLLGADLLNGPAGCGWGAVLDFFSPDTKASVYKVAHHGSSNAHHDNVWERLLVKDSVALLAPFRRGNVQVPSDDDRKRICAKTSRAYITAKPEFPASSKTAKKEAAMLGQLAWNAREVWGSSGQVRARSGPSRDGWTVETVAPAHALCPI